MKKFGLTMAVVGSLLVGAAMTAPARAMPAGPGGMGGLGTAAGDLNLVEKTQFVFGGRRFCWYDSAWSGPGWYWCGYAWRRGFGWGGPRGWHGWAWRGWRGGPVRRFGGPVRRGGVVIHGRAPARAGVIHHSGGGRAVHGGRRH